MKLIETIGATSRIWQVFIADSSSTTGAGLTGLVFNTASLTCYYHRDTDTTATVMTLVTMTVGTFTSLGFKEIDATNMPGWYQLCPPNAAIASGAKSVALLLKGATNMAPLPIEVELTAFDLQTATQNVTATTVSDKTGYALTQTFPTNFSTFSIDGSGKVLLQATQTGVTIPTVTTVTTTTNLTNAPTSGDFTSTMKTSIGTAVAASAVASVTGNVGGNVTGSIGSLATQAKTDVENAAWDATLASHLTSGSTGAALNAAGAAGDPWTTTLPGAYGAGTAGFIVGTNLNATITSRMGSYTQPTGFLAATFPTGTIANTTNITAGTITTVTTTTTATNLTNAPTSGDFTSTMKTSIGTAVAASAVASVTGNVGGNVVGSVASVTNGVNLAANAVDSTALATSAAQEIATAVGALSLGSSNNNFTLIQGQTVLLSAVAGKVSGEDTGAPAFRDLANTKDVITGTDDGDGNRLTITYNP